MPTNDARCRAGAVEQKEKVEAILVRLQSLRRHVSELRGQCEALKKFQSEKPNDLICKECGKLIELGQEVVFKGSFGDVRSYYHKDCFKAIWLSQNWIFDYSQPGFLRMSGKDELLSFIVWFRCDLFFQCQPKISIRESQYLS